MSEELGEIGAKWDYGGGFVERKVHMHYSFIRAEYNWATNNIQTYAMTLGRHLLIS